jgi:crossover junction endodeoxyribonuclease RuvC
VTTRTSAGDAPAPATSAPRVIGLDLSLTSTGLACTCGIHRIKSHPSFEITQFSRLRMIRLGVMHHIYGTPEICGRGKRADLVVVEDLALTRSTGQHLTRAGLWHLVMEGIDNEFIPYAVVSPTSLKKYVTGKGNASKDEVLAAAIRRYPTAPISGNDEADAYALRAMGLDHLGHPAVEMPKAQRAALDKITWPEVAR